mmetsp:Transcript_32152/g.80079  ORF Transcript_32152/g.80079 Transcript_32152/m.80079 type:complete len:219 (+) Transcript_32152:1272-1928(+)
MRAGEGKAHETSACTSTDSAVRFFPFATARSEVPERASGTITRETISRCAFADRCHPFAPPSPERVAAAAAAGAGVSATKSKALLSCTATTAASTVPSCVASLPSSRTACNTRSVGSDIPFARSKARSKTPPSKARANEMAGSLAHAASCVARKARVSTALVVSSSPAASAAPLTSPKIKKWARELRAPETLRCASRALRRRGPNVDPSSVPSETASK